MTRGEFAKAVTEKLGFKSTLHTRRAWAAWMQAEGGGARNNPMNTTLRMPGSTNYNSVGVQHYVSPEQGVEAMAKTLREKGHRYEEVRRLINRNGSATSILEAVGDSEWGTDGTLAIEVLDDIKNNRTPNTLPQLEAKKIAS